MILIKCLPSGSPFISTIPIYFIRGWGDPAYTVKKGSRVPVPSRDVTTKLSLDGNYDVITELFLPRGSLVSDIPAGDGKLVNLFYGVFVISNIHQQSIMTLRRRLYLFRVIYAPKGDREEEGLYVKINCCSSLQMFRNNKFRAVYF